jgi:putative ABC transport system permease protein
MSQVTGYVDDRFGILDRLAAIARGAMRSHRRAAGLSATIVVTLTLGIGVSLATFSLVSALLLQPIAGVPRPGELVRLSAATREGGAFPLPSLMLDPVRELPAFASVCGVSTPGSVVIAGNNVFYEGRLDFSGDCFGVLGLTPHIGRLLTSSDERTRSRVAVVTYDFWQRALSGTPDALGQTLEIDGERFTVVGVTKPAFRGLMRAFPSSLAIPAESARHKLSFRWCEQFLARRREGLSFQDARVQVETAWPQLKTSAGLLAESSSSMQKGFATSKPIVAEMSTGIENSMRTPFQPPLLLTFGLSLLMLAICAANAANLLVTRALTRQREFAVRLALGAGRWDRCWQSAAETLTLVLASALFALPLARGIIVGLLDVLRLSYWRLDVHLAWWSPGVAIFLAVIVVLTTIAGSVAQVAVSHSAQPLAELARGATRSGVRHNRPRRLIVTAQIAVTVLLVGSAAIFFRTMKQYYAIDPGFAVDSVLASQLIPLHGDNGDSLFGSAYYEDLLARIEAIPGVRAVSLTTWLPLGGPSRAQEIQTIPPTPGLRGAATVWTVTDRFFESAGIALRDGSTFRRTRSVTPDPTRGGQPNGPVVFAQTAILSESLATRLFPKGGAVGARVRVGVDQETSDVLVVGVVADARLARPQARQAPIVYLNYWENPAAQRSPYLLARAADDRPERLAPSISTAVRVGGREFTLWTRTIATQWNVALMAERLLAGVSGVFGVMAVIIMAAGLFGLLSHYVTTRQVEIGVRLAVGARAQDVVGLLFRELSMLLVAGSVAGVALLLATSRVSAMLLLGVGPLDPSLIGLAVVLVVIVALMALVLPLRRATAIDPLIALRSE